jgi:hypothetical protein
LKRPDLIVVISRGLGFGPLHIKARSLEVVSNSTIVVTDVHGEAHYIPKSVWESFEVRQPVAGLEVPQGAT